MENSPYVPVRHSAIGRFDPAGVCRAPGPLSLQDSRESQLTHRHAVYIPAAGGPDQPTIARRNRM